VVVVVTMTMWVEKRDEGEERGTGAMVAATAV
jgi:hypothetical protein